MVHRMYIIDTSGLKNISTNTQVLKTLNWSVHHICSWTILQHLLPQRPYLKAWKHIPPSSNPPNSFLSLFFFSFNGSFPLFLSVSVVTRKSHLSPMKECLALIQSHNSSSIEDSLKQAGDTEENTKLATCIFGKGLHIHKKTVWAR